MDWHRGVAADDHPLGKSDSMDGRNAATDRQFLYYRRDWRPGLLPSAFGTINARTELIERAELRKRGFASFCFMEERAPKSTDRLLYAAVSDLMAQR